MRILNTLLALALLCLPFLVAAQPGDPGGDPDVPISGIEWLIGGGALFGIRKLWGRFKEPRKS